MDFLENSLPPSPPQKSRKSRRRNGTPVRKTHDDPTRVTLAQLAEEVMAIGEATGEFSTRKFCDERGILRRRLYDVTNIMETEGLMSWLPDSKKYRWHGLEGMRSACREFLAKRNLQTLLEDMFKHPPGGGVTALTLAARFLASFYVFGYCKASYEPRKGQLFDAINKYISEKGLKKQLGLSSGDHHHKKEKNVFRRVYDVVNVFTATGFYKCADAVIDEICAEVERPVPLTHETGASDKEETASSPSKPSFAPSLIYTTAPLPPMAYAMHLRGQCQTGISYVPGMIAEENGGYDQDGNISGCSSSSSDGVLMDALLGSHADNFVYTAASDNELLFGFGNTISYLELE